MCKMNCTKYCSIYVGRFSKWQFFFAICSGAINILVLFHTSPVEECLLLKFMHVGDVTFDYCKFSFVELIKFANHV